MHMRLSTQLTIAALLAAAAFASSGCATITPSNLQRVTVSADKTHFVLPDGKRFTPWGFNYDHDEAGRLIEDYWLAEWPKVEEDFAEMKALGANVVRVHLQFGKFMNSPTEPNESSLNQLDKLVALADRTGLYLDLTGLGCYHKQDVPAWYDALDEAARWRAQAAFWSAIAKRCAGKPAVFFYDLMNELVVAGGGRKRDDWLGGAFAGKHFVQFINLESAGRVRHEIARQWIDQLVAAIRKHDKQTLITVGLVDWSLERPGLQSGFVPAKVADSLDFICVHIYPHSGKLDEALTTLRGFGVGKPVIVEETFPLRCTPTELEQFIDQSQPTACGWIGFYWGKTLAECKASGTLGDAIMAAWLEMFERRARQW
jgi:hypothetical protein